MHRFILILFSATIWLLAGEACRARSDLPAIPPDYLIDCWTSDDGLPQNSVISMTQAANGSIWVSTFGGVARFDGRHFHGFAGDEYPALAHEVFTTVRADASGRIWLRGEGRRLVVGTNGFFRVLGAAEGVPEGQCMALETGRDGSVWVSDAAGRLLKYEAGRFVVVCGNPPAPDWKTVVSLKVDAEGNAWALSRTRSARCVNGRWEVMIPQRENEGLKAMRTLPTGGALVIAGKNQDRLLRYSDGKWTDDGLLPELFVGYVLDEDSNHEIWVSNPAGLAHRDAAGNWSQLTRAEGLPNDLLRSQFRDREENLWLGTDGGGLLRLKRRSARAFGAPSGMSRTVALSVAVEQTNQAWVAVLQGGLNYFDGRRFAQVTMPGIEVNSLVWTVLTSRKGHLWIGNYGGPLFQFDPANKHLEHYAGGQNSGMLNDTIRALFESSRDEIWIGGIKGLARYSGETFHSWSTTNGLLDNQINAIAEDRAGRIWVGSERGLNRLTGDQVEPIPNLESFNGKPIRSLYCDSRGAVWIGGRDLTRYEEGRVVMIRPEDGLPAHPITGILEDNTGFLWLATPHGILRCRRAALEEFRAGQPERLEFAVFSKSDGLPSNECTGYQPSVMKGPDGRLWFTTVNGLAVIDPEHLPRNPLPPPVLIEGIQVDDQQIYSLDRPEIRVAGPVKIPAGSSRIEFRFAAMSFTATEKNRYRYRLEPFETEWVEAGNVPTATYTRPPPGRYRFQVSACNNDGVWNESGATLDLAILPFFWQTRSFEGCVLFAVVGSIYLVFRLSLGQVERRRQAQEAFARRMLETQEAERQRIARELHDGVGQSLILAKNHLSLATLNMAPPEASSEHLGQAAAEVTQALDEIRATARALRPAELDCLGLREALESMLERIRGATSASILADLEEISDLIGSEIAIQLYRIAQEAVNNVLKHSQADRMVVELRREGHEIRLTVLDNGAGFDPAVGGRQGAFGLPGMVERARLIGGALAIKSAPGKGCRLTVTVPVFNRRP